jgi:hypothetical protein
MSKDTVASRLSGCEVRQNIEDSRRRVREPEARVVDLDLSANLDGYWPSSGNVTQ